MSLFTMRAPWLNFGPRVEIGETRLMARTSWQLQALALFSYCRVVVVDRAAQSIDVRRRVLWILRSVRRYPFDTFDHINYEYGSIGTFWGLTASGVRSLDRFELFTVQLVAKRPEQTLELFSFAGDGAATTGLSGVILAGDSPVDFEGDQEDQSRGYVELLAEFTGLPLGPYVGAARSRPRRERSGASR